MTAHEDGSHMVISADTRARIARPTTARGFAVCGFVLACTFLLSIGAPGRALANKNIVIVIVGGGSVVVDDQTDDGFDGTCTSSCTHAVGNDDTGTLTATPNSGWVFSGWSNQTTGITGCLGNQCNFSMGGNHQGVTATFTQFTGTVTQTATQTATQTITSSPTRTVTQTPTVTRTVTVTGTVTVTQTASPSQTVTVTQAATPTQTTTVSRTVTATATASRTTTITTTPEPEAGHCNDNIDNDHNGRTDCADPACFSDPSCAKGQREAPAMTPPWLMFTALGLFVLAVVVLTRKRLRE
jgi:hypothetical protein